MRAVVIAMRSPALDDDLGFSERVEDFPVQQFVPVASVDWEDGPDPERGPSSPSMGSCAMNS